MRFLFTFILALGGGLRGADALADEAELPSFEQYLQKSVVPHEVIDRFLKGPSWAQFDPELGYTMSNYLPTDGMDGSATISTVRADGARTSHVYAHLPCRINSYGDSFTQCHQVSDAETWQEYLAGHLGEPVRNFGMGGYGVYQSYRRMLREEQTDHGAEYLIFYIWGDDHTRSLLRCRHAIIYPTWDDRGGRSFHNNFWTNVEIDLETGKLVEHENRLPTRESLYRMSDPQWTVENLRDDLALELLAYKRGYLASLRRGPVEKLAAHYHVALNWDDPADLKTQVRLLLDKYSLHATRYVLEKARSFADQHHKKLLVVLFDPYRAMAELRTQGTRYDREIVDYLVAEKIPYFDMNEVHLRDARKYNLPHEEYMKQYFIGHYNPRGNHFFAYSIKDTFVHWLEPKPLTYRNVDPETMDFQGYLEGIR